LTNNCRSTNTTQLKLFLALLIPSKAVLWIATLEKYWIVSLVSTSCCIILLYVYTHVVFEALGIIMDLSLEMLEHKECSRPLFSFFKTLSKRQNEFAATALKLPVSKLSE